MSDDQSHKVVDLNNGKGAVYSAKGEYYMKRRANPKSGIRKQGPGDKALFDKGADILYGKDQCQTCGAGVLWKREFCDDHKPK